MSVFQVRVAIYSKMRLPIQNNFISKTEWSREN